MSQQPPKKEALVSQFLAGLPSHNPQNFQRYSNKERKESVTKKPKAYVSTKDLEHSQLIVTDKTNILLRYLRQKAERESLDDGSRDREDSPQRPRNPTPLSKRNGNDEFATLPKRPRRN